MNSDKVQELENLLDQAMLGLEIRSHDEQNRYQFRSYQSALEAMHQSWWKREPYLHPMMDLRPVIKDATVRERVAEFIKNELAPFIHEDMSQSAVFAAKGGPTSGFPLEDVLHNLTDIAILKGPQEASQAFYGQLNARELSYQRITVVSGFRVRDEIKVADGLRLVTLPTNTDELPIYLPPSLPPGGSDALRYTGKTVIIDDSSIFPRFVNPKETLAEKLAPFTFCHASISGQDFAHQELCEAIALSSNCATQCIRFWSQVGQDEIFQNRGLPTTGGYNDGWFLRDAADTVVTPEEIEEAVKILTERKQMGSKDQEELRVAVDRWMKSKTESSRADAFIDLGIALENLYLNDTGGDRGELGFRLAIRAAWWLGENAGSRKSLLETTRDVYNARSTSAHTGRPSRRHGNDLLARGQDICRKSIIKFIEKGGFPDWNEVVTGGHGK